MLFVCSIAIVAMGTSMVLAGVIRPMNERAIWTGVVFVLLGSFMLGASSAVAA